MQGHTVLIPNILASRERLEVFRRGGPPMARVLRVGLEYDLPPARARAVLEAALRNLPGLAPHPAPRALLHTFADWSVSYELRYWLEDYARYFESTPRCASASGMRSSAEGSPSPTRSFASTSTPQDRFPGPTGPGPSPRRSTAASSSRRCPRTSAPRSRPERAPCRTRPVRRSCARARRRRRCSSSRPGGPAVSVAAGTAASQKLALLDPGSAFGEISLLTGEPRTATVRRHRGVAPHRDRQGDPRADPARQPVARREARRDHARAAAPYGRQARERPGHVAPGEEAESLRSAHRPVLRSQGPRLMPGAVGLLLGLDLTESRPRGRRPRAARGTVPRAHVSRGRDPAASGGTRGPSPSTSRAASRPRKPR